MFIDYIEFASEHVWAFKDIQSPAVSDLCHAHTFSKCLPIVEPAPTTFGGVPGTSNIFRLCHSTKVIGCHSQSSVTQGDKQQNVALCCLPSVLQPCHEHAQRRTATHSDRSESTPVTCLEFSGSLGPLPDSSDRKKSEDGLLVPLWTLKPKANIQIQYESISYNQRTPAPFPSTLQFDG